jgi:hypothetical protein
VSKQLACGARYKSTRLILINQRANGARPANGKLIFELLRSEGFQELHNGFLIGTFQFFKLLSDVGGFAAVAGDSVKKC